ncbi:MAG: hypothetical protein B7Z40_13045 [Bosea sp. 12-68-7]|nr:MAG: hypothetical protein B7Z40_13045 [Bosea sp. 12-68-7]
MTETFFLSIMATGFVVAFAHAAIPTHWLPFVMAGRGQRWSKGKTLLVVAVCGAGHVLFTTVLGVLVIWLGIETSRWTGTIFPWIAGGALILFGLYYLFRQARGQGHGHSHFGSGGHSHGGHGGHSHADYGGHDHPHAATGNGAHPHHRHEDEAKRIDTGHGVLLLDIFEDGVPPRFRLRAEPGSETPRVEAVALETVRPDGTRHSFSFVARDGFLESVEEIPEPHQFDATFALTHGSHAQHHALHYEEHAHAASPAETSARAAGGGRSVTVRSDRAVIVSLFTLLTFSPCEGFLPVYLSGISYGWSGFVLLSAVLSVATISGMVLFTWLTMSGIERLRLEFLERYESGILGGLILFLGVGIIFLGF